MFEATAYLTPAAAALAAPLLWRGWKGPAAMLACVIAAAAFDGAPFVQALRVCAIGLGAWVLSAGLAMPFLRAGQLVSAAVTALLIGSVFMMSPAIARAPERAPAVISATCSLSPHAAVAAALGRDFSHERFFYAEQEPPAADYGLVGAPWYRAPLWWAAAGLPLIGLGLWRRRG